MIIEALIHGLGIGCIIGMLIGFKVMDKIQNDKEINNET